MPRDRIATPAPAPGEESGGGDAVAGHIEPSTVIPLPRIDESPVRREELLTRLRGNADLPVIVVDAPAGYGKTTLLRQWSAEDPRPVRWLTLTPLHDDPALLLSSLLGAVHTPEDISASLVSGPLDNPAFLSSIVLPRLARARRSEATPTLVVLDGTEVLRDDLAWRVLTAFLDASVPGTTFALAGRSQPPLPLGRWVTHRRLLWLRRDDLILTPQESRAVLSTTGIDPDGPDVAAVLRRCAGWAAGLALAAADVRGRAGARRQDAPFSGTTPLVRQYLSQTFLDPLEPDAAQFLLRVSVLRELTGPRCDALTESTGSGALLEELSRSNVLMSPCDSEPDRYRLHPLFVDLLTSLRAEIEPGLEPRLRRLASRAAEHDGEVEDAVGHARASGDLDLLADLVWANVARPRPTPTADRPLDRWLTACSTDQLRSHPRLALAAAWQAFENGRSPEPWASVAESLAGGPAETGSESGRTPLDAGLSLFRALTSREDAAAVTAHADAAVEYSDDDAWRCMACQVAGLLRWLQGDRTGAKQWLSEGEQLSRLLDVPSVEAQCLAQRAVLAVEDEDWRAAEKLSAAALEIVHRLRLHHLVPLMPAFAVSAVCSARRGEHAKAEESARQACRLLAQASPGFPAWLQVEGRMLLAQAHLMLGNSTAARSLLSEAQTGLSDVFGQPEFAAKLRRLWHLAEELPLSTTAGPSAISPAELRVIQLLPTHLSFREIGYALYLSRNTVKTQAIAAYRKLGVNSRTEAVDCAHAYGLLDQQ